MRIELSKNIKLHQVEFVGEVDFFETSPYIALLKDINTKEELISKLEEKNMPKSAIKNIIKKLEDLKVLKDGNIQKLEDGFPEKEYGKYALEYFENDTNLPFKFRASSLERKKAVSRNSVDDIQVIDKKLLDFIVDKNYFISDKKDIEIIDIEKNKGLFNNTSDKKIELIFEKDTWKYTLTGKTFDMDGIDLNVVFRGEWDSEYNSFNVEYDWIKKSLEVQKSFKHSFNAKKYTISKYGEFSANFENIPIIPKTELDALKWFINLLKDEIEQLNRYISKAELQQLWENLKDKYPKFKKFELEFNFETILKEFGKSSKYYWLLQAGIDLYPFDNSLSPKSRVIIEAKEDVDLEEDFFNKFHIEFPQELIIVDRWIVNLVQYKGLEKILEALGNPSVTIVTQKVQDKKNDKLIVKIIENNNIKIIEKPKSEIVHQRYWIFDKEHIYLTSESLDFIHVDKEQVNVKYTTFEQYENDELDSKLLTMEMK
ncbi:MAG: hypothetical protein U9P72_07570 [Campylobacterota bacterium]|nr:hypothetical protein [Campylobacterota bacterium]